MHIAAAALAAALALYAVAQMTQSIRSNDDTRAYIAMTAAALTGAILAYII